MLSLQSAAVSISHFLVTVSNSGDSSTTPTSLLFTGSLIVKVKVTLRLTVSQSVSLGIEHPLGAHDKIFFSSPYMKVTVLFNWGVLSDERSGLSLVRHSPY
jgi:hypothetical protein